MAAPVKRPYDARRRRERADDERAETRRRVVDAAKRLFLERGYTATTMADIAKEAGVAVQSVYKAGQSKSDLMHHVVDITVAGDHDEVPIADRPFFAEIATERDAERQVRLLAAAIAGIQARLEPVWLAFREAAATDPSAAAQMAAQYQRRRETLGMAIDLLPAKRLRRSREESTDALWAIGSVDVRLLLIGQRGWDDERYTRWLADTLVLQLLKPPSPRRTKP